MGVSGTSPSAAVLVTTVQSLRNQGEGVLENGFPNLARHAQNLQRFGLPTIVAINRFPHDTQQDLNQVRAFCDRLGIPTAHTEPFTKGGEGSEALARAVVDLIDRNPNAAAHPIYALSDTYEEKLNKVATGIYGADGVSLSDTARNKLRQFVDWGYDGLPICVAKTQYSFSDNPKKLGAPTNWTLAINDVSLSAGAGFLVCIAGNMMLMPGLPKTSLAEEIDVDDQGEILGV
jgi:formate--tetrahydrofolate ligase